MESPQTNLSPEEREKPILVLEQLFDASDVAFYQQELWELLKAAMSVEAWRYLQSPGMVPPFGESLNRFMECCLLLLQKQEEEHGVLEIQIPASGSAEQLEQERMQLVNRNKIRFSFFGMVNQLTVEEIEEPLKAVKAFFSYADLASWKAVLAEWVEYALDAMSMAEDRQDGEDLFRLAYFQKLMEAAWLLFMEAHPEGWQLFYHQQFKQDLCLSREEEIISRPLFDAFHGFLKGIPAVRVNRNLRNLLIGYLQGN